MNVPFRKISHRSDNVCVLVSRWRGGRNSLVLCICECIYE